MIKAAENLLDKFEALPDDVRSEVVAEMARRIAQSEHDLPGEADLIASADRLFLDLDRREQADDQPDDAATR